MKRPLRTYGVVGEFEREEDVIHAAVALWVRGYRRVEIYSPHPIEGLAELFGTRAWPLSLMVFGGAVSGFLGGYALQLFPNLIDYPQNIGGRPLHSWPAFLPISIELAVLFAALGGFMAFLIRAGLPRLHHPLFAVDGFHRSTTDALFVCVEANDPKFHPRRTRELLQNLTPVPVVEVER